MQDEDWRIRRRGVDLLQRGHPPFDKLKLAPSSHHPHPLRRGCSGRLLAQHVQREAQRGHPFPAQLHVVVQPAANDVQMRIIETGNDSSSFKVDDFRLRSSLEFRGIVDPCKFVADYHYLSSRRMAWIERRDSSVLKNKISDRLHESFR